MNKRLRKKKEIMSKKRACEEYAMYKLDKLSHKEKKKWMKYMIYFA